MTSNRRILGRLALLPALALLPMPAVYAQEVPERGVLEIGVRALAGDRSSSQFDEYRDIKPGLFIRQASEDLEHLFQSKYFLNFQAGQGRVVVPSNPRSSRLYQGRPHPEHQTVRTATWSRASRLGRCPRSTPHPARP